MSTTEMSSQFHEVLLDIRRAHQLPHERAKSQEQSDTLLDILLQDDHILRTAKLQSLGIEEQMAIYSLYPRLTDPMQLQQVDRLVIHYPSWSLFVAGWTEFQIHFPNKALHRSLAWLWRYLQHAGEKVGPKPPYLIKILPESIDLKQDAATFLSQSLSVMKEDLSGDISTRNLEAFLIKRHLIRDSKFTALLLDLWAKSLDDLALYTHHSLLRDSWSVLPAKESASLISRVLSSTTLEDTKRNELLESIRLSITDEIPVIKHMSTATIESWMAWRNLNALRKHYRATPVKRAFILEFLHHINGYTVLDVNTIAWHFKGFYLVDNIDAADVSYIYPESIYFSAIGSPDIIGNLGQPKQPYRRILDPKDAAKLQSIIQLRFVEPDRQKAILLMQYKLDIRR